MNIQEKVAEALQNPFGLKFADTMAICYYRNGAWEKCRFIDPEDFRISPAAHVLHYASTCFEGAKVHRWADGSLHIFRMESHLRRFQQSARRLFLPEPDDTLFRQSLTELVKHCREWAPEPPGALYVRPTLIGTEKSIGSAATPSREACMYILLSPVGDYFKGGTSDLKVVIDDERQRTAPGFGMVKTGGNYAAALTPIAEARAKYGAHQVLFAPNGIIQETGAANFLLVNDRQILTKSLDTSFLHGITRDSLLKMGDSMGYEIQERDISVEEVLEFIKTGEAILSGTAAVVSSISSMIYRDQVYSVGNGVMGPNAVKLRQALLDIQQGRAEDKFGWLTRIV